MSASTVICAVPQDILDKLKEFRFRKIKINQAKFEVEQDQLMEGCTIDDIVEELPDNQPRYVLLSYEYKRDDGRVSYPLVFFYYSPETVKPETHMLYAGAKSHVVQCCDVGKVYDIRDAEEELTDRWLKTKLAAFK